jgi:hypothetical protein
LAIPQEKSFKPEVQRMIEQTVAPFKREAAKHWLAPAGVFLRVVRCAADVL